MEETTIKKLLNSFVSSDTNRLELTTPFKQKGFYFATDAWTLIAYPAIIDLEIDERDRPDCFSVIPKERTEIIDIETDLLNKIIEQLPLTDETVIDLVRCSDCYGSGEVTCNYDHEHDCPRCEGKGQIEGKKKTGKQIKDYFAIIEVWGILFRYQNIKKVFDVADTIGVKSFQLVRGSKSGGNLFQLNDFQVLIMPVPNFKDTEYTKINSCAVAGI